MKHLNLNGNDIEEEGARALAEALQVGFSIFDNYSEVENRIKMFH